MPNTFYELKQLIELNDTMSPAEIARYLTSQGKPVTRQGICHRFKKAGYQPTRHPRVSLKAVAELRKKGKTLAEIADETGIPFNSVNYRLKQAKVGKISRKFTPPNEAETFARLRINGGDMSQQKMADEFGVNLMTLIRWIRRYRAKINGNKDVG